MTQVTTDKVYKYTEVLKFRIPLPDKKYALLQVPSTITDDQINMLCEILHAYTKRVSKGVGDES